MSEDFAQTEAGPLELLVVQPTPFCNLDCTYCYLPDRNDRRRMSLATLDTALAWVADSGLVREPFTLLWHAGEPLVVPLEWYEAAAELLRERGAGWQVTQSFQTNATLVTEEWCRYFLRHGVEVGVSVDGPAFRLPDHLHAAWWELLDAAVKAGGTVRDFDAFAARVREFLAFKGLAPPGRVEMEALVTAPGRRSIRSDPETSQPTGLGPTVAPWAPHAAAGAAAPRLHAVVNLGDESSGVVFVNLPPNDLAAEVARRRPGAPAAATFGELAAMFLRACPDYPPVRLRLRPGEAVRLPTAGLILDGDPAVEQDPDVLLLVSARS